MLEIGTKETFSPEKIFDLVDEEIIKPIKEGTESNKNTNGNKIITKTLIPGLIHLVKEDSSIKYLVLCDGELSIKENYVLNKSVYQPKQDLPIKILYPEILEESRDIDYEELLEKVIKFIKKYLEMPCESDYLILALWIFHSYLMEKLTVTPILYFFGVKETGKTRAGEILSELAYRCERLSSPTASTLFRSANYFQTTLVIDEIKLWGPDGNKEVANLIKSRYKRGMKVSRINMNKSGEDQVEYFDVFAPLVICSTETMPPIIESRCITFLMQQNTNPEVEKEFNEAEAQQLRNKLTIFRANFFNEILPHADLIARRRLNEIMKPLYQVLMTIAPNNKEEFMDFVKLSEVRKEDEVGTAIEADIVEKINNNYIETHEKKFSTKSISDSLNGNLSEKEKYSDNYISSCIRRLGFIKTRLTGGKMGYWNDSELLEKLKQKYKIVKD